MQRRIPSLDGLRAVGLICVLTSHTLHSTSKGLGVFYVEAEGHLSMAVFFCISGYLITGQLLRSEAATGSIDLRAYFTRRFFRIIPPYYLFILTTTALGLVSWRGALASATFSYSHWNATWCYAHLWSLVVEEQFYLLWPLLLVIFGKRRAVKIGLVLIALAPLFRVAQYELTTNWRWMVDRALHTRIDALMSGCCMALLEHHEKFETFARRILTPAGAVVSALFVAVVSPAMWFRFGSAYRYTIGMSLETLVIAALVLYLVRNSNGPVGKVLNSRPVVHLGLISYGVYLWQQIFLIPGGTVVFNTSADRLIRTFPLNVIVAILVGELSYWTIEAWSLRVRKRLERRAKPAVLAIAAGD